MGRIGSGSVLVSLVAAVLGLTTTEASGQVTSRAFVSANAWDTLFELDSGTLSRLSPGLGVATTPQAVAASPDGRRAYVTNETSGTVAMIEVGTWTVLANVFVAAGVRGIAVSPDATKVYVADYGTAIDVRRPAGRLAPPGPPAAHHLHRR
jgi:YVTN family beta-propeller protein